MKRKFIGVVPQQQVIVNVDNNSIPTMYESEWGDAEGIYPAILRIAFSKLNEKVEVRVRPWNRGLNELKTGLAAAGALARTSQRESIADFSEPYFVENIAVYYNKKMPYRFEKLSDLYDRRVGVNSGWSYGAVFDEAVAAKKFIVESVDDHEKNLFKLRSGRIDFALAPEYSGKVSLGRAQFNDIVQSKVFLSNLDIHLAFNKGLDKKDFLKRFNKVIQEMKKSGELNKIVAEEVVKALMVTEQKDRKIKAVGAN